MTITGNVTNGTGTGASGLTYAGTGTLTLQGAANNYTGATTVSSGTVNLTGGSITGGGAITISGGTFTENSAGVISGASTFTVSGGTATLGGANTYSAATTLSAGTLNLNNNSALGNGTQTLEHHGQLDHRQYQHRHGHHRQQPRHLRQHHQWRRPRHLDRRLRRDQEPHLRHRRRHHRQRHLHLQSQLRRQRDWQPDLWRRGLAHAQWLQRLCAAWDINNVQNGSSSTVTIGGLTLPANAAALNIALATSGGATAANLTTTGAITRSTGNLLNLNLTNAGTGAFTTQWANGTLIPWSMVTSANGAAVGMGYANASSQLVPYNASSLATTLIAANPTSNSTNFYINSSSGVSGTVTDSAATPALYTLTGDTTSGNVTWNLGGNTAAVGNPTGASANNVGAIVTYGVSGNTFTVSNGVLNANTGANGELILNNMGAGNLTVSANIQNPSGKTTTLTTEGNITLSGASNTYSGATYIDSGTLTLAAPINSTSSITGPGNLGLNSSSALSQTVSNITLGGGIVEAGKGGVAFSGANCITLGNYSASGTIITMNASSGALAFNNSATPSGQSDSIALFINANTGNTYTISQNSNNLLSFNEAAGQTNVVEIGNSVSATLSINGSGTGGVTFNGNLQSNTGTAGGPNAVPILSISGGGVTTLNGSQLAPGPGQPNTGGILLLGNSYATAQDGLTMTGGILPASAH